jgi:hypothetical protein
VKFVLFYDLADGAEALAQEHFPAHRARLADFHERGVLLMVGTAARVTPDARVRWSGVPVCRPPAAGTDVSSAVFDTSWRVCRDRSAAELRGRGDAADRAAG